MKTGPPTVFHFNGEPEALQLEVTKQALARVPHFKSNNWPNTEDRVHGTGVCRTYGAGKLPKHHSMSHASNTVRSVRDRKSQALARLGKGNDLSGVKKPKQMRREVLAKNDISTKALSVKISAVDGRGTIHGQVDSSEEKRLIGGIADRIALGECGQQTGSEFQNQLRQLRRPLNSITQQKRVNNMLKILVFCIAASRSKAEQIVNRLRSEGYYSNDISALFPDEEMSRDYAYEKSTKVPDCAATGAGTGGLLVGALGWLTGIGALAIPGVGPLIVAGPIVATLNGAAVGGITGTLIGMGIPEYEAKRYEGNVKAGHILISVQAGSTADAVRAKEIFEETGAQDIATSTEPAAHKPKDRNSKPDHERVHARSEPSTSR